MDEEQKKNGQMDGQGDSNQQDKDTKNNQDNSNDNNLDDNFDPFASLRDKEDVDDKEDNKDNDENQEEDTDNKKSSDEDRKRGGQSSSEDSGMSEYSADKQARREVRELIKKDSMYSDFEDDLVDLASKAIQRGIKQPAEFAIRNLKSPSEWIAIGRKQAELSIRKTNGTRVNGGSGSRSGGDPDYSTMPSDQFNEEYNRVLKS